MSTPSDTLRQTDTTTRVPKRNLWRIYGLEAKTEFLKLWRIPAYSVSTLAFPLMFYLIFGLSQGGQGEWSQTARTYLLASYGVFGIVAVGLFSFGVSVATERGQGWMRLKRATPMPAAAYFVAKIAMSFVFSAMVALSLFVLGVLVGGVRLPAMTWLLLFAALVLGVLPFCAMGLAMGYIVGPNSASTVLNLTYLPMSFASGLWIPIFALPNLVQRVAPYLPPYHYVQLALTPLGMSQGGSVGVHLLALFGFTALFLLVAVWAYRRDEGKTYG